MAVARRRRPPLTTCNTNRQPAAETAATSRGGDADDSHTLALERRPCGHLTGYGAQTALNVPALRNLGHDVAISAFYGINGAITQHDGVKVYPGGYDGFGNDTILQHAVDHFGGNLRDGLVLTLMDVWVLATEQLKGAPTACWTPVDHWPPPAAVVDFFRQSGATAIAMSRFGQQALEDQGIPTLYVPHAVDTELFQEIDRTEARAHMGFPDDAFVVGMVAANKGYPPRKGFPEAIAAFARFAANHEDALLYLHTEPHGSLGGISLPNVIAANGLDPQRVRFVDPYRYQVGIPTSFMPNVYSAMNVLLNPSYGEGFGVPIIEAQACGTPCIVTDWTAMRELAGPGWLVDGSLQWSEQGAWRKVPSVDGIVAALEQAHVCAERRRPWARDFALDYDIRKVTADHWTPVLEELERRFAPVEIAAKAKRKSRAKAAA